MPLIFSDAVHSSVLQGRADLEIIEGLQSEVPIHASDLQRQNGSFDRFENHLTNAHQIFGWISGSPWVTNCRNWTMVCLKDDKSMPWHFFRSVSGQSVMQLGTHSCPFSLVQPNTSFGQGFMRDNVRCMWQATSVLSQGPKVTLSTGPAKAGRVIKESNRGESRSWKGKTGKTIEDEQKMNLLISHQVVEMRIDEA